MQPSESIWDNIKFDSDKPNVLKTLREQAQQLADRTGGILYAEVTPVDAYEERTLSLGVVYNFYVIAPFLANLRQALFTVVEQGGKRELVLVDKINETKPINVNNIDELISQIEGIIKSERVTGLITDLYASSMEARK